MFLEEDKARGRTRKREGKPHHTRGAPERRGITQRAPAVTSFLRSVYNVLSTRVASLLAFRCIINDRLALCTTAHTSAPSLRQPACGAKGRSKGISLFRFLLRCPASLSHLLFSRSTSVSGMHSDFLCGLSSSASASNEMQEEREKRARCEQRGTTCLSRNHSRKS